MTITAHINRIARIDDDPLRVPSGAWYPSQIGSCDRTAILKHAGVSGNAMSDETARRFWLGKIIHKSIQDGLGTADFIHEVEIKGVVTKWGGLTTPPVRAEVHGRIDSLRLNPLEVIELKSLKAKAFDYPLPQPAHILQVSCYLAFPPAGYDPQVARLVYISKDGDKIAEYTITKDPILEKQIHETIIRLEEGYQRYLKDGTLPPPLAKVQLIRKGVPVRYVRSGPWGKAGSIKMIDDHRVNYCDYKGSGRCCGD